MTEQKQEKIFADGLIFKKPSEKAPDFVKGNLSFKVEEFKKFLDENINNGWVNIDLKESSGGKYYAELNTWKPKVEGSETSSEPQITGKEEEIDIENLPFNK